MPKLKLNADAGESYGIWTLGRDAELLSQVHLANLACGFHASDPDTLREAVALCQRLAVEIGAHPGYPDRVGFGRRHLSCTPLEVENLVLYQLGALEAACRAEGTAFTYVKPHGALYHDMMAQPELLKAILNALRLFNPALKLVVPTLLDLSQVRELAAAAGIHLWTEAFADRAYQNNGQLVPRSQAGAVLTDPEAILEQARCFALGQAINSHQGQPIQLSADLLCVHGDNPESLACVKRLRALLDQLEPR